MIIFQIIQKPQHRGAELFAIHLSEYLKFFGHTVIIIALFKPENSNYSHNGLIKLKRPYHKRNYDFFGWSKIAKLIHKYQPDIIQCNSGDTLKYLIFSKMIFGWKLPIIERNASLVGNYITNPIKKWAVGKLYEKTTSIISVSYNSKDNLVSLYTFLKDKTTVIPIGVEIEELNSVTWNGGFDALYHLIHVGGFSFEKNHKSLLKIYKKYLEIHPNSHLHLLGDGPLKGDIETYAKEIGLSNSITFYGWVDTPIAYIAKADLLVLPSLIEGMPSVLLEAMIAKTTVVAYDVGGVSEIIENLKTGYLVAKNNEKHFLEAMINAIKINNDKLINNAYELVTKNYKIDTIAKQFEAQYLNIVKAKNNLS